MAQRQPVPSQNSDGQTKTVSQGFIEPETLQHKPKSSSSVYLEKVCGKSDNNPNDDPKNLERMKKLIKSVQFNVRGEQDKASIDQIMQPNRIALNPKSNNNLYQRHSQGMIADPRTEYPQQHKHLTYVPSRHKPAPLDIQSTFAVNNQGSSSISFSKSGNIVNHTPRSKSPRPEQLQLQIQYLHKQIQLKEEQMDIMREQSRLEKYKLESRIRELQYKNQMLQKFSQRYAKLEKRYQDALADKPNHNIKIVDDYQVRSRIKTQSQSENANRNGFPDMRSEEGSSFSHSRLSSAQISLAMQQKQEYQRIIFQLHNQNKLYKSILDRERLLQKPHNKQNADRLRNIIIKLRGEQSPN